MHTRKHVNTQTRKHANMQLSSILLALAVSAAVAPAVTAASVPCANDEDCSLNGACTAGLCVCDAGWTTLPFGVGGAMSPGCGYLDFRPSPVSVCGEACAFHGGAGGVDTKTTSWGGSVNKFQGKCSNERRTCTHHSVDTCLTRAPHPHPHPYTHAHTHTDHTRQPLITTQCHVILERMSTPYTATQ